MILGECVTRRIRGIRLISGIKEISCTRGISDKVKLVTLEGSLIKGG